MARSATRSGKRPRPDAQRRQPTTQRRYGQGVGGKPLFFERIRRNTKWVFVLLALVFALSFVLLGVGSGSSGLGDLLQGNFSGLFGGGGGASIRSAQKQIAKHPNDPAGYKKLAQAYENRNDVDAAIPPLVTYVGMRPHDVATLQDLAARYQDRVQRLQTYYSDVQSSSTTAQPPAALALDPTSSLGKALSQDQITTALQNASTDRLDAIQSALTDAQNGLVSTYQKIVAAQPDDPTNLLQLAQAAQSVGDTATETSAYLRFLKLAPDDPSAPDVRKQLKALTQPATTTPAPAPKPKANAAPKSKTTAAKHG
jgi:tetratricopeptide (TPR) repeat protein